jgi:hypothetical protein
MAVKLEDPLRGAIRRKHDSLKTGEAWNVEMSLRAQSFTSGAEANESGVDACALPPHSKTLRDVVDGIEGLAF